MPEAKDPNNTEAAFDENWASATEAGEYLTQNNFGAWVLAPVLIREALLGGCPAVLELDQGGQKSYALPPLPTSDPTSNFWFPPDRLRWVNALNPSMRREDFFDRPWRGSCALTCRRASRRSSVISRAARSLENRYARYGYFCVAPRP